MDIDFAAVLRVFTDESAENLAAMEAALLALESAPDDGELLNTIFRGAHTLKGDAGNLGMPAVAELAHGMEDLLDLLREGRLHASGAVVALLLQAVDELRLAVPAAAAGNNQPSPGHAALLHELAAMAAAATAPGGDRHGESAPLGAAPAASGQPPRTLRVAVDRLDRAMDLVGEIAIARGRVTRMLDEGCDAREVLEARRDADSLHSELQDVIMRLRMVPLGTTFRPHLRTVRDVAFAHGKLARLELLGEEVEVDTSVVELLRDPLTHLLRNALDHGIEAPETRLRAGKDAQGTVTLSARHEGGTVVVCMSDDGGGLDRAAIAARVRQAGLAADPERLPDAELFRHIFAPGFSTAAQVTDLSGRGVGMDVVRRNVEALRGTVSLASLPGEGTTVTLRLPLTLAVIDGFAVGVASETYVIPLDQVVECLEMPRERHDSGDEGVISLRGQPLPFVRLRDFLGATGAEPQRENVVVIRHQGAQMGLVVDELLGESQAVIKPLGALFRDLPAIAGSTILGSGQVALIVDVPAVIEETLRRAPACALSVPAAG